MITMGRLPQPARQKKAITMVAHALLVNHLARPGHRQPYDELGADYLTRRQDPEGKAVA